MNSQSSEQETSRRSFIAGAGAGVLGVGVLGGGVLASAPAAFANGNLSQGDAAILRFLSAAEILETDLWQPEPADRVGSRHAEAGDAGVASGRPSLQLRL